MFDIFGDIDLFMTFFLVFIRVSGILHTAPVYGSTSVDVRIRIFLSMFIALAIFPSISVINLSKIDTVLLFIVIIKELLIGIAIGLIGRFLFVGVQFGGQLIGFQMGFGVVNVLDPQTNTQVSIIAQFQNIIMILLFFAFDGHILVLEALSKSFKIVPLATFVFPVKSYMFILHIFSSIFVTAIKIIAPVFIALVVTHAVMGIIGRLVPQINVMIVGFPIQIAAGILVLIFSMDYFVKIFEKLMFEYFHNILNLFKMMS
jgi:flagellar biosynthetic protein FliR